MKIEMNENNKKKELKFSQVIINMELGDLEKIREILLDKPATSDNIDKLDKIDELIAYKNKRNDYMERTLNNYIKSRLNEWKED